VADEQQDPVMVQITEAVELGRAGDGDAARWRLTKIWGEIGPQGDPFHRCVLAHFAADVQSDVKAELMWDLRALAAAGEVTDERAQHYHGSLSVAGFYPSLYASLADDYRRLGDWQQAQEHLRQAQDAVGVLGNDPYGRLIREGIARCADELAVGPTSCDGGEPADGGRPGWPAEARRGLDPGRQPPDTRTTRNRPLTVFCWSGAVRGGGGG
jgi:hypothetical protein